MFVFVYYYLCQSIHILLIWNHTITIQKQNIPTDQDHQKVPCHIAQLAFCRLVRSASFLNQVLPASSARAAAGLPHNNLDRKEIRTNKSYDLASSIQSFDRDV